MWSLHVLLVSVWIFSVVLPQSKNIMLIGDTTFPLGVIVGANGACDGPRTCPGCIPSFHPVNPRQDSSTSSDPDEESARIKRKKDKELE